MKKFTKKFLALLSAAVMAIPVIAMAACGGGESHTHAWSWKSNDTEHWQACSGCDETQNRGAHAYGADNKCTTCGKQDENVAYEHIDYVSQLHLNMNSETKKQEVEVRMYIDGDTTHFDPINNAAEFEATDGYIKARYLAINTPESTGKIEKWGKTASNFTHDTLAKAESIIVESDDGNWNVDSTGSRYLLWVWYKLPGETEYRNLNVEILQNGFALASATASNRYGTIAVAALEQAQREKLHVFSPPDTVDDNFYEGAAIPLSLKELRCHVKDYIQISVRVEGVVTADFDDSVYIEDYDPETGLYFGMVVYYGKTASAAVKSALKVGNKVNVVGSITEFNGTYQISGVSANLRNPSEDDTRILEEGKSAAFVETSAKDIVSGTVTVTLKTGEDEEGNETFEEVTLNYGEAILNTTVTLSNLKVTGGYTTDSGSSKGAMSLYCQAEDGTTITVRTTVLTGVTFDDYRGKTINVKGIVDYYNGSYQVKVHRADYITILD